MLIPNVCIDTLYGLFIVSMTDILSNILLAIITFLGCLNSMQRGNGWSFSFSTRYDLTLLQSVSLLAYQSYSIKVPKNRVVPGPPCIYLENSHFRRKHNLYEDIDLCLPFDLIFNNVLSFLGQGQQQKGQQDGLEGQNHVLTSTSNTSRPRNRGSHLTRVRQSRSLNRISELHVVADFSESETDLLTRYVNIF